MKKRAIAALTLSLLLAASAGVFADEATTEQAPADTQPAKTDATPDAQEAKEVQGMKIITESKPEGETVAQDGDVVVVHYTGTLDNGKQFDSSRTRGRPFSFKLNAGSVIKGWDIGIAGMAIGEKRKLIIPPELGYGDRDMGEIPPNSTLTFEVELYGIVRGID